MNERIKHLAEQVDKEFNSPYDRYKAIERFAELIVRECADLVADDDNAFDVLKHFGVEE